MPVAKQDNIVFPHKDFPLICSPSKSSPAAVRVLLRLAEEFAANGPYARLAMVGLVLRFRCLLSGTAPRPQRKKLLNQKDTDTTEQGRWFGFKNVEE